MNKNEFREWCGAVDGDLSSQHTGQRKSDDADPFDPNPDYSGPPDLHVCEVKETVVAFREEDGYGADGLKIHGEGFKVDTNAGSARISETDHSPRLTVPLGGRGDVEVGRLSVPGLY
jgi:hypothetical protein